MICPNCHTPNRSSAKYCDECGYELPSIAPTSSVRVDSVDGKVPTSDLESASTVELEWMEDEDGLEWGDSDALTEPIVSNDLAYTSEIPLLSGDQISDPVRSDSVRDYRIAGDAQLPGSHDCPKRKVDKKKVGIIAAALILLVLAAAAVTYFTQFWGGRVVPDVTGMAQVDATYAVQEAGFTVQVEEVTSDEVEGIVLSSDPAAGMRVPEKTTVTLRISIARFVPDIAGKPLEEAESLMREAGFTNYEVVRKKSNEAPDTVLSVNPAGSTRAKADARITIEVAEPFRVPDVAGKTQEEAEEALKAEGYEVDAQRYNTEDAPEGQVVKTEPAAGTALNSGSAVVVYVAHNRSAELVQLTREFFTSTSTITMNGSLYEMSKVDDVAFEGGNTCKFSITVRPIQTVIWFGTQTETRYGNYEVVNGTMVWTDGNKVASIDPSIKQGS